MALSLGYVVCTLFDAQREVLECQQSERKPDNQASHVKWLPRDRLLKVRFAVRNRPLAALLQPFSPWPIKAEENRNGLLKI